MNYARLATPADDAGIPLIRELMSYDALCPASCVLHRSDRGILEIRLPPSPLHWSRQVEWPWALREGELGTQGGFGNGLRVMDLGGGWSIFKYALSRRCEKVLVGDTDRDGLEKSMSSWNRLMLDRGEVYHNIAHAYRDARLLTDADATFDRVFCISVLEHVPDGHVQAVREMVRVLKPGGLLLLSMDVVLKGELGGKGNFYVGEELVRAICAELGIGTLQYGSPVLGAAIEQVEIGVLLIKWRKPA